MDQLQMEKLGIPTVTVTTDPFADLARAVAASESVPGACVVSVPHPIGMLFPADVEKKAENAFPEILKMATRWQPPENRSAPGAGVPAGKFTFHGTIEELNADFRGRGWSLGLPIIPPTEDRVRRMVTAAPGRPDSVLGQVPPRMGTLTVELAAVHAVMAGCPPNVLPVLIACLEGFLAPEANWRGTLTTTGTTQFVAVVNGPVVGEAAIGSAQGAAGKGHHANAAIGYALNLIAYVVGGSRPPAIDRSTLASPSDYVCWVFGENEKALPPGWEPLHVERGFKASDSVVTVMASYPPIENIDHWSVSTGEFMRWWRSIISPMQNMGGPCSPAVMELNPIVALGPEHAQLIAAEGWGKGDFRKAFWEHTRIPASSWPSGCTERQKLEARIGPITPESAIPVTYSPDQLLVMIAGGEGKHSHYFAPFPGGHAVSRIVKRLL